MNVENLPVGVGLYLEGSVFDHSCKPNATVVFAGKRIIVRTIRSVLIFIYVFKYSMTYSYF